MRPTRTVARGVGHVEGLVTPLVYVEPQPNVWHTLRVVATGQRVVVYVDGEHIIDWRDMGHGEGRMAERGKVALRFSNGIDFRTVELSESAGPIGS